MTLDQILDNLPAILTAVGTLIAAIGAFVVSLRNATKANAAAVAAEVAKVASETAATAAKDATRQIVVVGDDVVEVGKRIDGRLTQLLEQTALASFGEGHAAAVSERAVRDSDMTTETPTTPEGMREELPGG